MTVQEQIEILQAYERGEVIEWRRKNSDMNFIILNYKPHDFNFEYFEYRIKPKRWRAEKNGTYYFVVIDEFIDVCENVDTYCGIDNNRFKAGNYFRTMEDAKRARDLMKECLNKIHEGNDQ